MKNQKNGFLIAIALLSAIALVGNAQALVEPVAGAVDSTAAEGQIVTLYLDINPADYVTVAVTDSPGYHDFYYFNDIEPMLLRNGYRIGSSYPATVEMRCRGYERDINGKMGRPYTNTFKNTTPSTARFTGKYDGTPEFPPEMELEFCEAPKPDLNVTAITVNYDAKSIKNKAIGPVPHPGARTQCNNLSAVIEEDNGIATGAFDVTFKVDRTTLCTVRVPGLAGGATETVFCNCSWYPYAGTTYTLNVTADSSSEISETDESNNTMLKSITAQWLGFKGDGWQDADKNITTRQCHDKDTINLTYSLGDSYYLSATTYPEWTKYVVNWTADNFSAIPPEDTTTEKARLYVYYGWDKSSGKNITDYFDLKFNGNPISIDSKYFDLKELGSNTNVGLVAYDVTDDFRIASSNKAVLTNSYLGGGKVCMVGMLLAVVYNNPNEPERIIWINEGTDFLWAKDSYGISSEEATTYALFEGCEPIPLSGIGKAKLITVAPWGSESGKPGPDMNRLYFNDGVWKTVWAYYWGSSQLSLNETDVLAYLKASNNIAALQSHIPDGGTKGDYMAASNAILIVEYGAGPTVSISTDKFKYCYCNTMLITIDISNPTKSPVTFKWYLGIPTFGSWTQMYKGTLPAGYEDTHEVELLVGEWGETPFSAVWYVDLQEPETGQELVADCACWSYCPTCGEEAIVMPVDIAEEIKKTIEKEELSC